MAPTRGALLNALKSFTPDVGAALRRFPLASLIATLFTLLHLFEAKDVFGLSSDAWMRVSFGLGTAFLWSFAVGLHAVRQRWATIKRIAVEFAGFAVIAALYTVPIQVSLQPQLVFLSAGILVGLAAYIGVTPAPNAAFWQFNHHLWLGAGLSLLGALLFAGGLSLIVETLELLFELDFPRKTHEKVWTVAFGLIAPLNWLSLAPRDFSERVREGEQNEFTSRAISVIVKFILVPLLLVYTAILYAYTVKIAIDGVLPKGRLGPMVLAYGALMAVTVLFAWPARAASGPLVAIFWRHWYWLILGPVALLFLAAYKRIGQYGLTEERYMVALAGVWLALLAIWFLVRGGVRDLRVLPASLALFLFVAAVGPWGAVGASVWSQKAQLADLLERRGRLKDGRIILADGDLVPPEEGRRAASILLYLRRKNNLHVLRDWFADIGNTPFKAGNSADKTAKSVSNLIGAPAGPRILREAEHLNFTAARPISLPLSAFDQVIGPISIKERTHELRVPVDNGIPFTANFEHNLLTVRFEDGREIHFDLQAAARKALTLLPAGKPGGSNDPRVPLRIPARNTDDGSILIVQRMWGQVNEEFVEVRSLDGWILLNKN